MIFLKFTMVNTEARLKAFKSLAIQKLILIFIRYNSFPWGKMPERRKGELRIGNVVFKPLSAYRQLSQWVEQLRTLWKN